ncbi:MAG TPA: ABC transporter permease [Vicinamibacterales bacterium]|nr:ABC transporter permease [Vicinamibacterales bacterium]
MFRASKPIMLFQDIRFGLRTALKNKGVTALAVTCLAIGIGLNTMMFSVTDGVLVQPLPYHDPDNIVALHTTQKQNGVRQGNLSWLDLQDWKERSGSFSSVAGLQYRNFTVSDGGDADRYLGAAVSHDLFPMLGTSPQLGRGFTADDDRPGAEPVLLISDDLWKRRYNSDPTIVGRSIQINSRAHTVVGVMPRRFKFPENQYLWLPLSEFAISQQRALRGLEVFARLKPGETVAQAQQESDAVAANLSTAFPDTNQGWGLYVEPLRKWALPDDVKLIILTMMGSVTMVLLIACFNVANLMLARASSRSREMSIRTALGAGRGQILRQLLTESVLVGLFSVPLGLLCAYGGLKLIDMSIPPDNIPYFIHWELNVRALLYAIGVAGLTGIVFGLAPAIQASKTDLQEALKDGGRGTAGGGRAWIRNTLVVAEVALSLLLLIGASLFVRSFLNLQQANGGFEAAPLMTMRFYMPNEQYATPESKVRRTEDILRRVEALPGVQAAFASNLVPLSGGGSGSAILIEGRSFDKGKEPGINYVGVSPHMLKTLGLSMIRGRELTDTEAMTKAPYAVINQAMAKRFWPNEDPLGHRFRTLNEADGGWFTIVGVAPDFKHGEMDNTNPIPPCAYVSLSFGAFANTGLTIRAAGDPALLSGPAREAIRASDPRLAVFQAATMNELRQRGYWQYFLFGWMFSLYGGIALVLAAIGVYGVLSYSVEQRTQEIGVRMALGAGRSDVLRLVVIQGIRLAIVGVVIGVVGSFFITPIIKSELVNVSPTDPLSFIGVSFFLTAIAFMASYVPARRAMSVDPLIALRAE